MNQYGAPADNWASGTQRKGLGAGAVVAICVGVFIFGCLSGYLVGIGQNLAGLLSGWMPGDAEFQVVCDEPTVGVGQEFEFVVSVTDLRGEARVVSDIDFEGDFVDHIEVVSVTPNRLDSYADAGYIESTFQHPVAAGSTTDFTFTLKASSTGTLFGYLTVYDADYNWTEVPVTIEVSGD